MSARAALYIFKHGLYEISRNIPELKYVKLTNWFIGILLQNHKPFTAWCTQPNLQL